MMKVNEVNLLIMEIQNKSKSSKITITSIKFFIILHFYSHCNMASKSSNFVRCAQYAGFLLMIPPFPPVTICHIPWRCS